MITDQNLNTIEENDLQKIIDLIKHNYLWFIISFICAIGIAFIINRYAIPVFRISSSILIKEENSRLENHQGNDYLNSSLFEKYVNFQNELWTIQSTSIYEETAENLDLTVSYYKKKRWQLISLYKEAPFKVLLLKGHIQPINVLFSFKFLGSNKYQLTANAKKVLFYDFDKNIIYNEATNWNYNQSGILNQILEDKNIGLLITRDSTSKLQIDPEINYLFSISDNEDIAESLKSQIGIEPADKKSTVISLSINSTSVQKGIDIINEVMHMYSKQNLDRKNHMAITTVDYIDKQLTDISDSLNRTEKNLQSFRSKKQLLNVTEQATGIDNQYMALKNQKEDLVMKKKYYDYLAENIDKKDDYSNITVPSSMGIQDNVLNNMVSDLINAYSQKTT